MMSQRHGNSSRPGIGGAMGLGFILASALLWPNDERNHGLYTLIEFTAALLALTTVVLLHHLKLARQAAARAEQATRDHAARLQAILDAAVDAIITIDEQGTIESLNPAAERLFGYSAAELVGRNVSRLMPAPFDEQHGQYLRNYLQTGVSKVIGIGREVVGLRSNGTTFPAQIAVSEARLGPRRMFTGIVRDITETKKTLQQLSDSNQELAKRTRQIEQFNLDLCRSNDELKQFAYVASHDLQEPLRKIVAFCQMLKDEYDSKLDDEARRYIQHAVDGALRMKTLVSDLLTYSRVETQGKPLVPTAANDACDEAIENLSVTIEESGADVTRSDLPVVTADRVQLARLFQNLIGNAIKYRGQNPPRIQIRANELDQQWLFKVRDNGIGIDPRFHQRIFVIFQRLHTRDQHRGTGIGLAVCKRIVERAGGRIWVESTPGEGSEFCFTLPKPE
jgi:PAS domain S-box-containing protein